MVIFQENVSFDHYFGTYPHALNPPGEPRFVAAAGTPKVNGLTTSLLTANPNGVNPKRLPRDKPVLCHSSHHYASEQRGFDHGRMDRFVADLGPRQPGCNPAMGMDYFDGNTVTALWNYAQHFALNDNSFATMPGGSRVGAINLVSGQTHGIVATGYPQGCTDLGCVIVDGSMVGNTVMPSYDNCAGSARNGHLTGRNIGDLLDAAGITWGMFSGGFKPTAHRANGTPICGATSANIYGRVSPEYTAGDEPFQYYRSTANPNHLPPSSIDAIGRTDQANHQYDLAEFWTAVAHDVLPAVSILKAPQSEQGGCTCSSPLDEQRFLVDLLNRLQRSPDWSNTAVIIAYDDSDGGYDHVMPPIVNSSRSAADSLNGEGVCGTTSRRLGGYDGRCGYGPRLPLLVISPYSRVNYVDHTLTDQTSIIAFIEDNWLHGQRIGDGSFDSIAGPLTGMFDFHAPPAARVFLNPTTGLVESTG